MSSTTTGADAAATATAVAAAIGGLCGRCRKKTAEAITRLCHVCGVALHASCSHEAAVRECELDYGFPVPLAFCSKRCYDADGLYQQHTQQSPPQQVSSSQLQLKQNNNNNGKRPSYVPNEIIAALTVKIGDVNRTSRKQLSLTTFPFVLSEGFEAFKNKVNSRTTKELQTHTGEPHVRDDPAIYIKPGVHSKQSELVELNQHNFEARVARSYRNFLKRKAGANEVFECDVLTYVRKDVVRRRGKTTTLTPNGSQLTKNTMTSDLHAFMDDHSATAAMGSVVDASSTTTGLLVSPDHGTVSTSGSAGDFASLSGTKRKHGADASALVGSFSVVDPLGRSTEIPEYKTIRMILNGAVVAVPVNVRDLLGALSGQLSTLAADPGNIGSSGGHE